MLKDYLAKLDDAGLIKLLMQNTLNMESFDNLSEGAVQAIEDNLNNRPRKVLGYQTSFKVKSEFGCVALRC